MGTAAMVSATLEELLEILGEDKLAVEIPWGKQATESGSS